MIVLYDDCLDTTAKCIAAAERCAAICGTSGDAERERCAVLGRDCADVGRLVETLMLRRSPYAPDACTLHAVHAMPFRTTARSGQTRPAARRQWSLLVHVP